MGIRGNRTAGVKDSQEKEAAAERGRDWMEVRERERERDGVLEMTEREQR